MSFPLSNSVVGHWCGGVHVAPVERSGIYALAATPVYLDQFDAMLLFVIAAGGEEAARQALNEHDPGSLDKWIGNRVWRGERDIHDTVLARVDQG